MHTMSSVNAQKKKISNIKTSEAFTHIFNENSFLQKKSPEMFYERKFRKVQQNANAFQLFPVISTCTR